MAVSEQDVGGEACQGVAAGWIFACKLWVGQLACCLLLEPRDLSPRGDELDNKPVEIGKWRSQDQESVEWDWRRKGEFMDSCLGKRWIKAQYSQQGLWLEILAV
jgi:hypothetical protein